MKTLLLVFASFLISTSLLAQYTTIPDPAFEWTLVMHGQDSDGEVNGQVLTSDMEAITEIAIINIVNLYDLTGIEACINLEWLHLQHIGITVLDLSYNINLEYLHVVDTPMESINLNYNINLDYIAIGHCYNPDDCFFDASLTEINLSGNTALTDLSLFYQPLVTIDLTHNLLLDDVGITGTHVQVIDLSSNVSITGQVRIRHNENLTYVNLKNGNNEAIWKVIIPNLNPNLQCIQVDDPDAVIAGTPPYDEWEIDEGFLISDDCGISSAENLEINTFEMFPNPATDVVNLTSIDTIKSVNIYTILGNNVFEKTVGEKEFQIPISSLSKGIYSVIIQDIKGRSNTNILIKL